MKIRISTKHSKFIAKQIKSGAAKSPQDVLDRAMALFAVYDRKLAALRRHIDKGIASADAGKRVPLNDRTEARILAAARKRAAPGGQRKSGVKSLRG